MTPLAVAPATRPEKTTADTLPENPDAEPEAKSEPTMEPPAIPAASPAASSPGMGRPDASNTNPRASTAIPPKALQGVTTTRIA